MSEQVGGWSLDDCLHKSLDDLMSQGICSSGSSRAIERWDIPPADRAALEKWGVPVFDDSGQEDSVQLIGRLQAEDRPSVRVGDLAAYAIGRYWRREIALAVGTGVVVGIPDDPTLSLSLINSSASAFVEISWRWACARRVLLEIEDCEELYEGLGRFQDFVHEVDPVVRDDARFSWWNGIVEGW